jgi:hypothetical protein
MSFDVTKIHIGAARIWTGVTPAASGTPPTYIVHTNGVPATGTEIGLTDGDCMLTYLLKKAEITAEQSLAPVDVFADAESASLEFSIQELNAEALKRAFDSSVGYDNSGGDGFYFGGGTAVLAPMTTCVFFSAPRRDNPAKYLVGQLYKAYSKDGIKFPMSRTKKGLVKVTLIALADLTRTARDQMGYFRREL